MPVTKTAKRALRVSKRKFLVNADIRKRLEVALREAKKSKTTEKIGKAMSLADRAAKKNVIHKNKASRIKSSLAKLMPRGKKTSKKTKAPKKQTSKKKAKK